MTPEPRATGASPRAAGGATRIVPRCAPRSATVARSRCSTVATSTASMPTRSTRSAITTTPRTPPSARSSPSCGGSGATATTGAGFRAWLFRIAHNTVANAHRTRRRRRLEPLPERWDRAAPNADPATLVARAEEGRRVLRAVRRLPEDRRQVVLLRFVDGLSARGDRRRAGSVTGSGARPPASVAARAGRPAREERDPPRPGG